MKLRNLSILILIIVLYSSCKKQEVEPVGFTKANYVTKISEDQIFEYYHDDGKYIGYGLEQYVATIKSSANTFDKEQLLIMTFRSNADFLPDTINPFTYFLGTNYKEKLKKEVEYRINLNYHYDNSAHENISELEFYMQNLDKLHLFKLNIEPNGEYYYDPNATIDNIDYTIDTNKNDLVFTTDDINSAYALCFVETPWADSIKIIITDGAHTNNVNIVEKGLRNPNELTNEGTNYLSKVLRMQYTIDEQYSFIQTNENGWQINDIYIDISNPKQGIINSSQISFNLLINDEYIKTHLQITANTIIEIERWPEFGERGKLHITGSMLIAAHDREVNVDIEISFKRQR